MSYSRRDMIGTLGAIPTALAVQVPRQNESPVCSGTVRPQGPWTVQLVEPNGSTQTEQTNLKTGEYQFKQPAKADPYILVFRDQNSIAVHEVRRLTAGIRQIVSVTINPGAKTVQAIHDELQAVESLAVFAQTFTTARETLRADIKRFPVSLGRLRDAISSLPLGPPRNFLQAKVDSVQAFVETLG